MKKLVCLISVIVMILVSAACGENTKYKAMIFEISYSKVLYRSEIL